MNYFHLFSYNCMNRGVFLSQRKKPKEKNICSCLNCCPTSQSLETLGNREIIVEGCKGIAEYSENLIKLNTGTLIMGFSGEDLLIQSFDNGVAVIKGVIAEITFVT